MLAKYQTKITFMDNDFKEVMSQRTNEELIIIVTEDRENYQASAVEAAEKEIEKRKIDPKAVSQRKEVFEIETAIRQDINSKTASLGSRIINIIIDSIAIGIIVLLLDRLISFLTSADYGTMAFIISYFGYYIYMENKYQQTLGKFYTKTKVVTLTGDKPKLVQIIGRTFLRTIPYDSISFLIEKKVFHDNVSNTTVIRVH